MTSLSLPTRRADWRRIARTLGLVFRQPPWLLAAVVASVVALTLFVSLNAPVYVQRVVIGGDLSLSNRIRALVGLYPLVSSSDHLLRDVLLTLTAGVVGTNVTLLGYHLTTDQVSLRSGSGSVAGIVLGTLGAGCAPCGLAVVASVLSVTGVATGLTALPLQGAEFLLVALAVGVLSLHWLVDGMRGSEINGCPVDL